VAHSTTEAEFISSTHLIREALWLQMLLQELKLEDLHTPVLYCDNQTALGMLNDELVSLRTKHLEVRFHFIKEKLQESSIKLSYVPSSEMVANMFTKPLTPTMFGINFQKQNMKKL
jgi:hypothetical protein